MNWFKKWFKKPKIEVKQEVKEKTTLVLKSKYLRERLPEIEAFKLKERRRKLNLTQEEVSIKTGIIRTTILNLERNVYITCKYSNIVKLHNFYLQEESKLK